MRYGKFIHLALMLAVIVTAGVVGAARGQARVAGQMVICSGGAVVTVDVDATGKPVGPVHVCPDCVMTLLAATEPPAWGVERPISLRLIAFTPDAAARAAPVWPVAPSARGPPDIL